MRFILGSELDEEITDNVVEYSAGKAVKTQKSISDLLESKPSVLHYLNINSNPHNDETWIFYKDSLFIIDQEYSLLYSGKISYDLAFSKKIKSVYFESQNVAWVCGVRGLLKVRTHEIRFKQLLSS